MKYEGLPKTIRKMEINIIGYNLTAKHSKGKYVAMRIWEKAFGRCFIETYF